MGAGLSHRLAPAVGGGWRVGALTGAIVVLSACGAAGTRSTPTSPTGTRSTPVSEPGTPSAPASQIPRRLLAEARPIGAGARFQPPASGPIIGRCERTLGRRYGVHVEVFAANRVVIVPAGIGVRAPVRRSAGRIASAGCYGALVTLEPTGLVLVRAGLRLSLSDLFRSWGQPLSSSRLASFGAAKGDQVAVFVAGRRWRGAPGDVPLSRHAEIVAEVGPYVPPHPSYTFPPGT